VGESEPVQALREWSLQVRSPQVQQALRMAVPPQLVASQPALSVPRAQLPQALPVQLALPLAQQESRALPV
jgi:hypothetical protein